MSRGRYDTAVKAWDAQANDYHLLWGQYQDLLEKYHALKLAGHVDTPVYPEYIDQPKTVDEVDEERAKEEQG